MKKINCYTSPISICTWLNRLLGDQDESLEVGSRRIGTAGLGGSDSATKIEMCSFLAGSVFSLYLRYRLGSLAVDPKTRRKETATLKAEKCAHLVFVCDNVEQVVLHPVRD